MTVGLIREGGRQVVQGAGAEGGDGADRAERPVIGQYGVAVAGERPRWHER